MATISWMPTGPWLLGYVFPPSAGVERLSGCWFSLLLSKARVRGSWQPFSCSAGLGGGEGDGWGSAGLAE